MGFRNIVTFWWTKLPLSRKFKKDVLFNYGSLAFLGISGVALNILVAHAYGASGLGFFNKIYSLYMVSSQFAVGSVHLSVQKYIASEKPAEQSKILNTALVITFFYAILTTFLLYLSRNFWASLLKNPDLSLSIIYLLPGLVAFALNKTILSFFNGRREMKIFAFFQTLRYLFLLVLAVGAVIIIIPKPQLALIFSLAEASLWVILFFYSLRFFHLRWPKVREGWFKTHLLFSYRSFLGNILTDLNSRIGILVLSYFTNETAVGVFSFAATLIEGFSQLLIILKVNVNPILAKLAHQKQELTLALRRGISLTYKFVSLSGLILLALYPVLVYLFVPNGGFMASWPVLAIMLAGLMLGGGYQPFQMLLAQSGHPALYTELIAIVFFFNLVLCLILIPLLGIYGAALAVGLAFIASAAVLKELTRKALQIKI